MPSSRRFWRCSTLSRISSRSPRRRCLSSKGPDSHLEIAAAIGLGDPAALAAAVRDPAHPVTRTATERTAGFDVRPLAAGGPALRSHLPLIVGIGDQGVVVGVLAVAHDQPMDDEACATLEAVADLAAVTIASDGRELANADRGSAGRLSSPRR